MFGSDSSEKIFLVEPMHSDYKTKLKTSQKVSFGLIKVELVDHLTYEHEITFIEQPQHDQIIDLIIEPFNGDIQRIFLYVYMETKTMKGKYNWIS